MKIDEVAKLTGYSKGHIYNLVSRNQIPFKKLSRNSLRFDRVEIEGWIQERIESQREESDREVA